MSVTNDSAPSYIRTGRARARVRRRAAGQRGLPRGLRGRARARAGPGARRVGQPSGSTTLSLCTTTHPLCTRFTERSGASLSGATVRPSPVDVTTRTSHYALVWAVRVIKTRRPDPRQPVVGRRELREPSLPGPRHGAGRPRAVGGPFELCIVSQSGTKAAQKRHKSGTQAAQKRHTSKSSLRAAFVWAHGALRSPKRRCPAHSCTPPVWSTIYPLLQRVTSPRFTILNGGLRPGQRMKETPEGGVVRRQLSADRLSIITCTSHHDGLTVIGTGCILDGRLG